MGKRSGIGMSMTVDMRPDAESISKSKRRGSLVRTGCYTCKIRHIKCDESRPACLRCVSTGRRCDGYLPPKSWLVELKPTNFEDGSECRAHQYFRERTGPELSRYYEESFWNELVPQASFSQDAIKHCLVAISSFHEKLEGAQTPADTLNQSQYSLRHYGKAIHLLSTAPCLLSTEETLINCILFIWFETLQNNLRNTCRHLESGLKIVDQVRRSRPMNASDAIETILAPTLERLKLKADIYSAGSRSDCEHFIPERFINFEQARQSFAQLIAWSCLVLRHITLAKTSSSNQHERSSTLARRLSGFDMFSARLDELLRATRSVGASDKLQGILILKTNQVVAQIILAAYLQLQESAYDRQRSDFAQVVDLCQEYLISEPARNDTNFPMDYSNADGLMLENGVIPYLLFTVAHCRYFLLRQRAMNLLQKYPRREGAWDSHVAAKVGKCIAALEKQDLTQRERTFEWVPETNLIRVLSIAFYTSGKCTTTSNKNVEAREEGQSWNQSGRSSSPTRTKISFLRAQPTNAETLVEEVWMDDTGKFIAKPQLTNLHLYWRQDNELLPLVGARIVSALYARLSEDQRYDLGYRPASNNLQAFFQRFWGHGGMTVLSR